MYENSYLIITWINLTLEYLAPMEMYAKLLFIKLFYYKRLIHNLHNSN